MISRIARRQQLCEPITTIIIAAILAGCGLFALILAIPFYVLWTSHRRKIEEMRLRHKVQIADETKAAIAALRQEFTALRDTTTQYDVSFDTALHRIESRLTNVEQRVNSVEHEVQTVGVNHK